MIKQIFSVTSKTGKFFVGLASLAFITTGLLNAWLIYIVVDLLTNITDYTSQASMKEIWVLLFGIIFFKAVARVVADMAKHYAGFDVVYTVRDSVIRILKKFSLGFFTNERLGNISTIIHKDVDKLEAVVGHFMSVMISDIVVALVLGIWLFTQNIYLGLAMISLLPVAVIVLILGIRKNMKLQNILNNDLVDMVSLFIEYTKGIPLMKAFPENEVFQSKLKKSVETFENSSRFKAKSSAMYVGQFKLFFELADAVMLIVGAIMLYQGAISVPLYLIFVIFSTEFYKPFGKIEEYWRDYLEVKDSYERVDWLLTSPTIPNIDNLLNADTYDISYHNVGFSYEKRPEDGDAFALHDVSFSLPQGSLTAFVGPSGSGKTTVANLLLRFWDNEHGEITVGGQNIKNIDYDFLLSKISIVMQNVILFADTIYENIKVGKKDATRKQVIEAAKKAQIHDFIMTLPQGYDTQIGENGVGLSGGQKQRISIARAFLKDAPILVLDEITSNVDPVNEAKIQKAISRLVAGRSVMVIAHHLRTIQGADNIIVLNNGSVAEMGTHENLLKAGGLYADLWKAQEEAASWQLQ